MPYATDKASFIRRGVFILALFSSVALGGCQSPMYSGTPDTYSYSVAPSHDPSYVGGNPEARAAEPAQQAWTSEQKYEYRGGRDPVSGRASTQM